MHGKQGVGRWGYGLLFTQGSFGLDAGKDNLSIK
jgi:hypothetical protein